MNKLTYVSYCFVSQGKVRTATRRGGQFCCSFWCKFTSISVGQKLLKYSAVWQSYCKNKRMNFLPHSVECQRCLVTTCKPQCIVMQPFSKSSNLLTLSWSGKDFMMISQTVQELSCWQTHKQRTLMDTTQNNLPHYTIAVGVVNIMKGVSSENLKSAIGPQFCSSTSKVVK